MPKQCTCPNPAVRAGRHETVCISCGGIAKGPLHSDRVPLDTWHTPATDYPRRTVGGVELVTRWYEPGVYHNYMQRGYMYFEATANLPITCLEIGGKTWMVDDPPHWWAMEEHAAAFHGHVVCAGLGLGLMVHAMTATPEVTHVTVIEREADVIELISPLVPHDKLTIVQGDFYEADPQDFEPADGVLFDLFVSHNGGELMGEAIRVSADILATWARDDDFVVRIHGMPNPYVGDVGRAICEAEEMLRQRR